MKVLVTGARGFVGKNLCAQLGNIKTGKAKYYSNLVIDEVYEYDIDSTPEQLDQRLRVQYEGVADQVSRKNDHSL